MADLTIARSATWMECASDFVATHPNETIAACSLVVALLSFAVAVTALIYQSQQAKQQRRHDVLSVRPILEVSSEHHEGFDTDPGKVVPPIVYEGRAVLKNVGLGPAIITRYRAFVDKIEYDSSSPEPIDLKAKELFGPRLIVATGWFLKPGNRAGLGQDESKTLLGVKVRTESGSDAARAVFNKLDCEIEYESIYGERFTFDTRNEPANRERGS